MTVQATPRPVIWTVLFVAVLVGFGGCFLFLDEPEPDPVLGPILNVELTGATASYYTDPSVGSTLVSGDIVDWGSSAATSTLEFTITNTGDAPIAMTQVPAVIIEDTDGSDQSGNFSIPVQPTSPINPGQSAPFEVVLTYTTSISFSVTVRLRTDDEDDDFVLTVSGWGQY